MANELELSYGDSPRIVLIGTSRALDEAPEILPELPHVKNNVDELSRLFRDPDVVGLPAEAVKSLVDVEEASTILNSVHKAAKETVGTLLVYYAGHGLRGDQEQPLYLCAGRTTDEGKKANGIKVRDLKGIIANAAGADKRILILDCCYAGAAFTGGMDSAILEGEVGDAIDIDGTYGIAAVPATYKALAPEGEKLTAFTRELVDVLEHGLAETGDVMTLESVFRETRARINRTGMPTPERANTGELHRFRFARNRWRPLIDASMISQAVEGLRSTISHYGKQIEEMERRLDKAE